MAVATNGSAFRPPALGALPGRQAFWLWLIVVVGAVLRLRQYAFNRSLWHDETLLATAIADRGYSQLILEPLANSQAAPAAYLFWVKFVTDLLGTHEWTLRLPSMVCGLAVLPMAVLIARLVFPSAPARATFVGLMAVSPVLVYYSSEFKQYQGDVLCVMLILWLTLRFEPAHWRRHALWLAAAGAVCIWLSHPVDFVLAGCGLTLWLSMARRREREALLAVTAVGAIWLASFAADYFLVLRALPHDGYLAGFWTTSFAPLPTSHGALHWYWESALGLVFLATQQTGTAFREVLPGWFSPANEVLLLVLLAGCAALVAQSRRVSLAATITLLATLGASALHQYPFRARLILFLVPFVLLALAALVQQLHDLPWRRIGPWLAAGLAVAILWTPLRLSARVFLRPDNYQDVRNALQYLSDHREPGDHILLSQWTYPAYRFYAPRLGLGDLPQHVYRPTVNEVHNIRAAVRKICLDPSSGRTWVLATNQIVSNNRHFLGALRLVSPPLYTYPMEGAALFLHDFRTSAYCQRYRSSPGAIGR
jgi:Dolichyl-phosphate-mannose-protein mannosyltransferase